MAKKQSVRFVCSDCGAVHLSYSGRCASCGAWNTLQEQIDAGASLQSKSGKKLQVEVLSTVVKTDTLKRISTGIADLDAVLGGGLVPATNLCFRWVGCLHGRKCPLLGGDKAETLVYGHPRIQTTSCPWAYQLQPVPLSPPDTADSLRDQATQCKW